MVQTVSSREQQQFRIVADRRQLALVERFRTDYGEEVRQTGVALGTANLVTSLVGRNVHMPTLDLDYRASLHPTEGTPWPQLRLDQPVALPPYRRLLDVMVDCGLITAAAARHALAPGRASGIGRDVIVPVIDLNCQAYLIASSSADHYHLYLNHAVSWHWYRKLLRAMYRCGLVETGFYRMAKTRHYTCLRLPWIPKEP